MNFRKPCLMILCVFVSFSLVAQNDSGNGSPIPQESAQNSPNTLQTDIPHDYPGWLLLEKGKTARLTGNLTQAFYLLLLALEKSPNNPEIEKELGQAFLQAGDFTQAKNHLNRALSKAGNRGDLAIEYEVRYILARIYTIEDRFADYEKILNEIISLDGTVRLSGPEGFDLLDAGRTALLERGLNRTLVLYRVSDSPSREAYRQLGVFYFNTGRYTEAINKLLISIMQPISEAIELVREKDLDYTFSGIDQLWLRLKDDEQVRDYLRESLVYESMFYLAQSLHRFDPTRAGTADEIYRTLEKIPDAQQFH